MSRPKNSTTQNQTQLDRTVKPLVSDTAFYARGGHEMLVVNPNVAAIDAVNVGSSLLAATISMVNRFIDDEPDADDLYAIHCLLEVGRALMDAGSYGLHRAADERAAQ